MRRELRAKLVKAWWAALGAAGLPQERWLALPRTRRRVAKAALWTAIVLVLVAWLGVWHWSALIAAAVVLGLSCRAGTARRSARGASAASSCRVGVLALAIAYPYYGGKLPELPLFGPFPQMSTMVIAMVFTMMALGLNFVVGYAGLLDLGYVAFYAMGAYTAGWFASSQFSHEKVNFGAVGLYPGATGIHLSMWLVLPMAGIITAVAGVLIGLPTLRLRGDYLAIVTLGFGEILPQVARNGDHLFGTNINLTNGTEGITPIDPPGFGNWLQAHLHLPANFFTARGGGTGHARRGLLLDCDRARADHDLLQREAARLTGRPSVDRDPRGRDRGRRDGHPVDADEDLGVCDRRVLRWNRRRVLRLVQERCVPR